MSPHQHDGAVPGSGAPRAAPRFLPAGPSALLLEVEGLAAAMAWHAELLARPLPGQLEALAAATTVLLRFDTPEHAAAAARRVGQRRPGEAAAAAPRAHTIGVRYDGEDLEELARLTGLSVEGVIAAHTGTPWTGAFGGFAPGFTYLTGGDPVLDVPRRSSPRTAVPAGSVALAGRFSAAYPRQSPGGWQLLGTTDAVLWDSARERPALIAPGDVVSFVPLRDAALVTSEAAAASAGETQASAGPPAAQAERPAADLPAGTLAAETPEAGTKAAASPALTVLSPGLLTAFQDLGRPGRGDLGVTVSGAADRPSAAQANRLVGNPAGAVVLETLLGGLALRAEHTVVLALTGAIGAASVAPADGSRPAVPRAVEPLAPFVLRAGETLTLGAPAAGLRGYVAVRGGFAAPAELGSASTDTLSGLGPAPLAAGQELAVLAPQPGRVVGHPEPAATALPNPGEAVTLRAIPGPRDDWFGPEGLAALESTAWRVTAQSDRVGARLELDPAAGEQEPLARIRGGELASEGVVAGSLQVPPSGLPVLFLADHPVTGGYPVIAVVLPADVALAAQLPPGTPVRLRLFEAPPTPAATAATQGAAK
ncbi:5-oxoprolinase subunit B/C family protein [Galactobacter valiniphilus]|uniref:5-oxoprolinase subunit B/C family protein n=1 Tax=Galactobacter valiniphilus TaxID=2676122 RepID=UPI001F18A4A5|nr:carboxyltransferase domain-containing protein [Galactobacter valiniphilus]